MLLNNQFKIFNKKGENINAIDRFNLYVTVIDPNGSGNNADVRAYTDYTGKLTHVEIVNPGFGYSADAYLRFDTLVLPNSFISTDPSLLIKGTNGELISFTIPELQERFSFPTSYAFTNYYLPPVSTGLIESENFFIIEKVLDDNGNEAYTFPRVEGYGPFYVGGGIANGLSATLSLRYVIASGYINSDRLDIIKDVTISSYYSFDTTPYIDMTVVGNGIPDGTKIVDVRVNPEGTFDIALSNSVTSYGSIDIKYYTPHNLRIGSEIFFATGPFQGTHIITYVSDLAISFDSDVNHAGGLSDGNEIYTVVPQFQASITSNSDPEFFLYTVEYGVDYPTITKSQSLTFQFTNPSTLDTPDTFSSGNGQYIRQVHGALEKKPFQLNIGLQADYEGVYDAVVEISDISFNETNSIMIAMVEGEVEGEDERLGLLLENFGRDVTQAEELIFRDSDINEDNVDYILLNKKRKEMLLQGEQIWPYVGSYRGLVNVINWFGYYDTRIKEYFLNVNVNDVNYNKYRQVQIPFQLAEKGIHPESLNIVPSQYYRKTGLFGLFYDIVKDSGEYDEYGIPITEDAFAFTNDEVLVKLFALKKFLKDKFLPLNTRIVDIAGEGVYYERFAVNSWSDRNDRILIDAGKKIDFTATEKSRIIDLRPYDSEGGVLSPELNDTLINNSVKYNFNKVTVIDPGAVGGEIPKVYFPGNAIQNAKGTCTVRAALQSTNITPSGSGYQIGDIITLSGGVYEIPIRIVVNNIGSEGEIYQFSINNPQYQGAEYSAIPDKFTPLSVIRPNGSTYSVPHDTTYFELDSSIFTLEVDGVILYDLGIGYTSEPVANFVQNSGYPATVSINYEKAPDTPIGYFSDSKYVQPYPDAPNIPVGAPVNVVASFNITWDELPYAWDTFTGSNDAVLKPWVLKSVVNGQIIAIEILSQGTNYTSAPNLLIQGGGGFGAVASASITNGKLNIVELTVTGVSTSTSGAQNDVINVSPALYDITTGMGVITNITPNHIVKGDNIPSGIIIHSVNVITNEIVLQGYDDSLAVTNIQPGDKIYVHQGVTVTNGGTMYSNDPQVSVNGGHTQLSYTWDHIGRGEFYEMEWKAQLTTPDDPSKVYYYQSGIQSIDILLSHTMYFPYTGKYTIELDLIDTNNNISNKIKKNYTEVYLPEADFAFVSKSVDDCRQTWDDFAQITGNIRTNQPVLGSNTPLNSPDPVEYNWDSFNSRWINITSNKTTWDDCRVNWDTLAITDLSDINYPIYPACNEIEVLQVSAQDVYEGSIISYNDDTTPVPYINPTLILSGQFLFPRVDPSYDPTDWLYLRRGDNIYQVEVLSANYGYITDETVIELTEKPPLAFRNDPTKWEVLREIGGTVAIAGNQIYDSVTNPKGFRAGEYVVLSKSGETPVISRCVISAKDETNGTISISNGASLNDLKKPGAIGKIYKIRNGWYQNGFLQWTNVPSTISSIDTIVGTSVGTAEFDNVRGFNQSGNGSAIFYVSVLSGVYSVNIIDGGLSYSVNDTIKITGNNLGGASPANDLTFRVSTTSNSSTWVYRNTTNDHETNDHQGQLIINDKLLTKLVVGGGDETWSGGMDLLNEIRPGFTRIKLYAYDGSKLEYEQTFRTKHISYNTSSVGYTYDIWQGNTYVIDVIGVDGGDLSSLNDYLNNFYNTATSPNVYLEYEYDIFTTRERYYADDSSDEILYIDFNNYPAIGDFFSSSLGYTYNGTNWFYDHGFLGNSYSLNITNVGTWRGGRGTLLTLDDTNYELFRTDTYFLACQQVFDEDYANNHIGTRKLTWNNYNEISWNEFCGSSWDTLDFTENLDCEFIIHDVSSNGSIRFNEEGAFNFTSIVGGMSDARKIAAAVQDLNNSDNSGISRFTYTPDSGVFPKNICNLYTNDLTLITGINKDWNNNIWVTRSGSHGTGYWNGSTWTMIHPTYAGLETFNGVDFMKTAHRVVICNTSEQLLISDPDSTSSWTLYSSIPVIVSFAVDTNDNIWIASNDGIYVLSSDLSTEYHFSSADGYLTNDFVHGFAFDYINSKVWVTCDDSLIGLTLNADLSLTSVTDSWGLGSILPTYNNFFVSPYGDPIFCDQTSGNTFIAHISAEELINLSTPSSEIYVDTNGNVYSAGAGLSYTVLDSAYNIISITDITSKISCLTSFINSIYVDDLTNDIWMGTDPGIIQFNSNATTDVIPYFGQAGLDTINFPNSILIKDYPFNQIGDVFYGPLVKTDSWVTAIIPGSYPNGYQYKLDLEENLPPKAQFSADSIFGGILKNVAGLHEYDLRIGDYISGDNITGGVQVLQVVVAGGMIREIILSSDIDYETTLSSFRVEWYTLDGQGLTIPWISAIANASNMNIYAAAKNPSVDNLGYLVGGNGVTFQLPQFDDPAIPNSTLYSSLSHTFPMDHFYKWFGFGKGKVGSFEYGLGQFLQQYRYAQVYVDLGTSPTGVPGWYPADELPLVYSYSDNPVFNNVKAAKVDSNRLPYERSIGGAYTWEEARMGVYQDKLPVGSAVLLSSDASHIAGKTSFLWRVIENGNVLVETTNNQLLWTFGYTGEFDVELTIIDSNGNSKTTTKKSFLIVYASTE